MPQLLVDKCTMKHSTTHSQLCKQNNWFKLGWIGSEIPTVLVVNVGARAWTPIT